jgi:DinB superfamily
VEYLAMQIIGGMPVSVRRLAIDMTSEQLHRRPAEHEWSIVEITGHLVDKTEMWGERLRRIASEDRPFLPGFDQDAYVRDRRYQEQELEPLLARLTALSTALVGDLRALPPDAWKRMGVHEERGPLSLGDACRIYAISIPDHVRQITESRDAALTNLGDAPAFR